MHRQLLLSSVLIKVTELIDLKFVFVWVLFVHMDFLLRSHNQNVPKTNKKAFIWLFFACYFPSFLSRFLLGIILFFIFFIQKTFQLFYWLSAHVYNFPKLQIWTSHSFGTVIGPQCRVEKVSRVFPFITQLFLIECNTVGVFLLSAEVMTCPTLLLVV